LFQLSDRRKINNTVPYEPSLLKPQGSGNTSYDLARAAALGPDGSMFLAGTAGDDIVVFHLDSNGDYIWEWEWEVSGTRCNGRL